MHLGLLVKQTAHCHTKTAPHWHSHEPLGPHVCSCWGFCQPITSLQHNESCDKQPLLLWHSDIGILALRPSDCSAPRGGDTHCSCTAPLYFQKKELMFAVVFQTLFSPTQPRYQQCQTTYLCCCVCMCVCICVFLCMCVFFCALECEGWGSETKQRGCCAHGSLTVNANEKKKQHLHN